MTDSEYSGSEDSRSGKKQKLVEYKDEQVTIEQLKTLYEKANELYREKDKLETETTKKLKKIREQYAKAESDVNENFLTVTIGCKTYVVFNSKENVEKLRRARQGKKTNITWEIGTGYDYGEFEPEEFHQKHDKMERVLRKIKEQPNIGDPCSDSDDSDY